MALTAAVITPERVKSHDFILPIAEVTQYYVVRTDESAIKSVADLAGKTVGVQSGGASYAALGDFSEALVKNGGKLGNACRRPKLFTRGTFFFAAGSAKADVPFRMFVSL